MDRNPDVTFLINDLNHSGFLKYSVTWRFDIKNVTLTEELHFIFVLSQAIRSDKKIIVANISLVGEKGTKGHRNLLFIDLKNNVYQLFEPNLKDVDEDKKDIVSQENINHNHLKHLLYFERLIKFTTYRTFVSSKLFNFGAWIAYKLFCNLDDNNKVKQVLLFSPCTIYCYIFLLWIIKTSDCSCKGDLKHILEEELDPTYIWNKIFYMLSSDGIKSSDLLDEPLNIEKCLIVIRKCNLPN